MHARQTFLGLTAAAASVAATSGSASAQTENLSLSAFLQKVRTPARHRQAFGSPRIQDGSILQYIKNSFGGFNNGWGVEPGDYTAVAVLFGSPCMLALNDAIWREFHLRGVLSKYSNDYLRRPGDGNPFAQDVDGLHQRGTQFYVCDNALHEVARRAATQGHQDPVAVYELLRGSMLPAVAGVVPAGVTAVSVLQENGYSYFFAAD